MPRSKRFLQIQQLAAQSLSQFLMGMVFPVRKRVNIYRSLLLSYRIMFKHWQIAEIIKVYISIMK